MKNQTSIDSYEKSESNFNDPRSYLSKNWARHHIMKQDPILNESLTGDEISRLLDHGWMMIHVNATFNLERVCLVGIAKTNSEFSLASFKKDHARSPLQEIGAKFLFYQTVLI